MTGHSIYIDCSKNMRNLIAAYPSVLTEGIDLHMGDPNQFNLPEIIKGYKGVLNGHTIMTPDLLKGSADTLCTVVFLGTGVANYVDPAVGNTLGIAVRNVAGYGDRSIAEHAFALLMAGARGLAQMDREIRGGVWHSFEGIELAGKTLGIVGTGAVGAELCRIANGFGMNCLAWNRSGIDPALPCREVPLEQLFRDADAISLHIAYVKETHEMIGAQLLQSVKPGAILVNTARGSVVDNAALTTALTGGPLGHAALDVFTEEPLDASSTLCQLQNVTLTAHAAWKTPDAADRLMRRGLKILQDDIQTL
jgi:D-3-phosphoglycerate dehydrogenase